MSLMSSDVFVARQPILDRASRVVAYELLFRDSCDAGVANIPDGSVATARVAIDSILTMGISTLLGPHQGFLNVDLELLASEAIQALPPERFVLEVLETVPPWALDRCLELKERGFRLALDDYVPGDDRRSLLGSVDYVKVDLMLTDSKDLPHLADALHSQGACLLAEKVETRDEFDACASLGFELFQGYFFARSTTLAAKKIDLAHSGLLNAFRALSGDQPIGEVEEIFKRDVRLGVQLLRIANSAALGSIQKITSFEHAIMYVGRESLRRWILLMLYAGEGSADHVSPAIELAAVRGRLLELLAPLVRADCGDVAAGEGAFLTGMLSLGDAILGMDQGDIVDELGVESAISSAINDRCGVLGDLLSVCEALEGGRFREMAQLLGGLGLGFAQLSHAQREAYSWYRQMDVDQMLE